MAVTGASLGRKAAATLTRVAVVRAFRAARYDTRRAGPLDSLVAPPYDVISPDERAELAARSPYNVVRLTLPDDEGQVGETWRSWLAEGVVAREEAHSMWRLAQRFVGPDGVERERLGLVCSLRVEPYERGVVRPHE